MIWYTCFVLSIIFFCLAILGMGSSGRKHVKRGIFTPFHILFTGVFLADFAACIPVFAEMLGEESGSLIKLFSFAVLQTIQIFTVNVGADFVLENVGNSAEMIRRAYSIYLSILFFVSPMLTFGFLISLFQETFATIRYHLRISGEVYAFSALNEKALALSASIREHHRDAVIVFTSVNSNREENESELVEKAGELGAFLFCKDMVSVDLAGFQKNRKICAFVIGDDESANLIQALKFLVRYEMRPNTDLYVFSSGTEGELLLSGAKKGCVRVRRINEIRSLIYHDLYVQGRQIFDSAIDDGSDLKKINAVILGLGKHGTEMLRALIWFGQMEGYQLTIDVFDRNPLAEDMFSALCPEIMSGQYNGAAIPGESEYTIRIHSGIDVRSRTFMETFASLPETSFVFVCLGADSDNICQSASIRMLSERKSSRPVIKTVVYNKEEKEALTGITNHNNQEYQIEAIGDFESMYSEEIIMGSRLEKLALARHLKWGKEEDFWQYEYNYRSSMASALHMEARIALGIKGAEKAEEDLDAEERSVIERLEHRRWNTYMRTEGYVYSGSPDKSSRNDMARMHHDLVDFESLTEEEKRKDSKVGSR